MKRTQDASALNIQMNMVRTHTCRTSRYGSVGLLVAFSVVHFVLIQSINHETFEKWWRNHRIENNENNRGRIKYSNTNLKIQIILKINAMEFHI